MPPSPLSFWVLRRLSKERGREKGWEGLSQDAVVLGEADLRNQGPCALSPDGTQRWRRRVTSALGCPRCTSCFSDHVPTFSRFWPIYDRHKRTQDWDPHPYWVWSIQGLWVPRASL